MEDNMLRDTHRDLPDKRRFRIRDDVRGGHREKARWLDCALSGQHSGNERDRVPAASSSFHAVTCDRTDLTASVGCCHRSALPPSSCWCMAVDLRGERDACTLSERLRPRGAGFREGASPESDGSDTIRAAVLDLPACRYSAFHCAFYWRSEEVSY